MRCREIVRSKKVEVLMPIRDKLKASDIAIRTDRSYLTHIFYEVVNNAIIYNNENGRVTIDMTDSPGLEIAVWDNGIGISETHIDKVFDNFFRVGQHRDLLGGRHRFGAFRRQDDMPPNSATASPSKASWANTRRSF